MGDSSARPVRPGPKGVKRSASLNPRTRPAEDKTKFDKWLLQRQEMKAEVVLEFPGGIEITGKVMEVDRYMIRLAVVEERRGLDEPMQWDEKLPLRWYSKSAIFSCS